MLIQAFYKKKRFEHSILVYKLVQLVERSNRIHGAKKQSFLIIKLNLLITVDFNRDAQKHES